MTENTQPVLPSFYERPNVESKVLPIAQGIKIGIERVVNKSLGLGGAYGGWGDSYDNLTLPGFVGNRLGEELPDDEVMNLGELGFHHRMHIPDLSEADHIELEVEVGARLVRAASEANGWNPAEVDGLLVGMSAPVSNDYVAQIARRAGMREDALKVSVHKACDGSMGALNLAINPDLAIPGGINVAEELAGKKV
ncbi:MAG: hypothetical protein R6W69_05595, partial [Anaerolineales bacterium]